MMKVNLEREGRDKNVILMQMQVQKEGWTRSYVSYPSEQR